MSGRKGRGRKPAAAQPSVSNAFQENVIDSTTETLNGKTESNEVDFIPESIKAVAPQKVKKSKKNEEKIKETKVAAAKPNSRGKKPKNIDTEEVEKVTDEKIEKIITEKVAPKRGRKKVNELPETNGDSVENDKEKINVIEEIPVDKRTRTKTSEATKQSANKDAEKSVKKLQSQKAPKEEAFNNVKEQATSAVVTKKAKGRKKLNADTVTSKKHKMNGTAVEDDSEEEVIPVKKARTARTKTKNDKDEIVASISRRNTTKHKEETKTATTMKTVAEEKKPTTARGGKRIKASAAKDIKIIDEQEENVEINDEEEMVEKKTITTAAKKRNVDDVTDTNDKKTKKPPAEKKIKMNATATPYENIDFSLSKEFNLKISSWNVAGLRAWLTKGGLEYLTHENPDIVCLQELKCAEDQIPSEARIPGYHPYWLCKEGGFNGIAIYSKIMPIHVEYGLGDTEQDNDSRIMTAEYEKFYLICVYVPNAGRKLVTLPKRLRWNEIFNKYLLKLNEKKPVIICGDMNVAHEEIDLTNPKPNKRNAGFTQEERDGMTTLLSLGFVDTFRHFYPNKKDSYTFWTYMGKARSKNVGWRLDYFLVSERFMPKIVENVMRSEVLGSDHCPITLFLNI